MSPAVKWNKGEIAVLQRRWSSATKAWQRCNGAVIATQLRRRSKTSATAFYLYNDIRLIIRYLQLPSENRVFQTKVVFVSSEAAHRRAFVNIIRSSLRSMGNVLCGAVCVRSCRNRTMCGFSDNGGGQTRCKPPKADSPHNIMSEC